MASRRSLLIASIALIAVAIIFSETMSVSAENAGPAGLPPASGPVPPIHRDASGRIVVDETAAVSQNSPAPDRSAPFAATMVKPAKTTPPTANPNPVQLAREASVPSPPPAHRSCAEEISADFANAAPGRTILLPPGPCRIDKPLSADVGGTLAAPVRVKGGKGTVLLVNAVIGVEVRAPDWIFSGFEIRGICADDPSCEHAFHITGAADRVVIEDMTLHNFNSAIKGNGDGGSPARFPNDVKIRRNQIYNDAPRKTNGPVNSIDVVGGRRWRVTDNFIADIGKVGGISFAAYLKGHSRDGAFLRNLIICEWHHSEGIRVGISFGGGGSGPPAICEDGVCSPEHENGLIADNVVRNCRKDVAIYLNRAQNAQVLHNTVVDSGGIDVRFPETSADIRENILSGQIRLRDGGTARSCGNEQHSADKAAGPETVDLVGSVKAIVDRLRYRTLLSPPCEAPVKDDTDFCDHPRTGTVTPGALQNGCDWQVRLPQ